MGKEDANKVMLGYKYTKPNIVIQQVLSKENKKKKNIHFTVELKTFHNKIITNFIQQYRRIESHSIQTYGNFFKNN